MRRALALALRGWGQTAPNPMVGAVVVAGGEVVGEGYHARYGEAHAEVMALRAARGRDARRHDVRHARAVRAPRKDAAVCRRDHRRGRRARRRRRSRSEHRSRGGGAARLRAAGIQVDIGVEREAACELNAPFFYTRAASDRPWVTLKLAISADGAIADPTGEHRWITGRGVAPRGASTARRRRRDRRRHRHRARRRSGADRARCARAARRAAPRRVRQRGSEFRSIRRSFAPRARSTPASSLRLGRAVEQDQRVDRRRRRASRMFPSLRASLGVAAVGRRSLAARRGGAAPRGLVPRRIARRPPHYLSVTARARRTARRRRLPLRHGTSRRRFAIGASSSSGDSATTS